MTSVRYGTPPIVSRGNDKVNARQLDAQFKMLVDRINSLIAALNVMREGQCAWLKDNSIRWRMFSETARRELQEIIAAVKAMRNTLRYVVSASPPMADAVPAELESIAWYTPYTPIHSSTDWIADVVPSTLQASLVEVAYWSRSVMGAAPVRAASWTPTLWFDKHTNLPAGFYADGRLFMVDVQAAQDVLSTQVRGTSYITTHDHIELEVRSADAQLVYQCVTNGIYMPVFHPNLTLLNAQQAAITAGWIQSSKIAFSCRPGYRIQARYVSGSSELPPSVPHLYFGAAFSTQTNMPPQDSNFPYLPIYPDAVGWQLDLLRIRKLPENRLPVVLLTQTGGWLEGAGPMGFIEIEEQDAANY